jgi:hypothetical protein
MTSTPVLSYFEPCNSKFWRSLLALVLLSSLLTGFALNAQPLGFRMGTPTQIKLKGQFTQILGEVKETFFVISSEPNSTLFLSTFDRDMNPVGAIKVSFPKDIKLDYRLKNAWLFEDRIILLSHCFNKALRQDQFHFWHLSLEGEILKGPVEATRINGNGTVLDPLNTPFIDCSKDRKVIYALHSEPSLYGQTLAGIRCKQWDSDLELLSNKTLNVSVQNQLTKIISADFRDQANGVVALDFVGIPKPGTKAIPSFALSQRLYRISLPQTSIVPLPISHEEFPYVHQIMARWSDDSKSILAVSGLSGNFKSGIQALLLQKWNSTDTTPIHRHAFAIPPSFKKSADLQNKKFRDTGTPKRPIKEVMDLQNQLVELDQDRFTVFGSVERINREISVGKKPEEVSNEAATYTHYSQGNLILNGTWSQGIQRSLENPLDQVIQPKGMILPTGIAGLPHYSQTLLIYNDLPENMVVRTQAFKGKALNNSNLKDSRSVLLHIDKEGRFSFFKPFANPNDQGKIYPSGLFKESNHSFVFLGSDNKDMMRLIKASY